MQVCILGDTVNSAAIAPLALGCDLLSHEATFIGVRALGFSPEFLQPLSAMQGCLLTAKCHARFQLFSCCILLNGPRPFCCSMSNLPKIMFRLQCHDSWYAGF